MMGAMFCGRLTPWLLLVALGGCSQKERAPQAIDTPSSGGATGMTGVGGAGGSGTGGNTGTGSSAGAGNSGGAPVMDGGVEGGAPDGAPDTPLVIIHQDAPAGGAGCANNFTAVGSNRLVAGGATPADFAAAYNAELDATNTPGPLLLAFFGVNDSSLLGWIAKIGALEPSNEAGAVGFAGNPVEVPYTLATNRSLRISAVAADFELRLAAPGGSLRLPLGSIALDGALSVGCGSLTVDKATLLVPVRAGALPFHGSTVEALMGPPTETLRGVARAAWPLELSGKASQVYAPGLLGDAGIEP